MKVGSVLRSVACGVLLLAGVSATVGHAAGSGEFKGSWIANGTRTPFPFGDGRQVQTFRLAGHVSLETALGKQKDYWSECVGLADSATGVIGRCVWRDLGGPEIYIALQGDKLEQGGLISGAIVGGTGALAGISGDLTFNWATVIALADADGTVSVTGQTKNLGGHFRLP
jgi:hypothetical protein